MCICTQFCALRKCSVHIWVSLCDLNFFLSVRMSIILSMRTIGYDRKYCESTTQYKGVNFVYARSTYVHSESEQAKLR